MKIVSSNFSNFDFWKRLFRFGSLYCIFGNTDHTHNWQQIRSHYLEAKSHTIVLTISSVLQHYAVSRKNGIQNKITQTKLSKNTNTLFRLQNIFTWMWSPVDSFPKRTYNYTSAIELFIHGFSCRNSKHSVHTYKFVCTMHHGLRCSEIDLCTFFKKEKIYLNVLAFKG